MLANPDSQSRLNTDIHWTVANSYLGSMLVAATSKGVCRLSFDEGEDELKARFPQATLHHNSRASEKLFAQVLSAVEQPACDMGCIPLDTQGTDFQEEVWSALRSVPAGETRSYADIAKAIGKPDAIRAVGTANGANRIAILIPCHRIIRSDGGLGGYAYGLERKMKLLEREKAILL